MREFFSHLPQELKEDFEKAATDQDPSAVHHILETYQNFRDHFEDTLSQTDPEASEAFTEAIENKSQEVADLIVSAHNKETEESVT